jgi:prepilin peptidase CpaA
MPAYPALAVSGQILLGILVAAAAVTDIWFLRIPNWLAVSGIVAGLAWNVSSAGLPGLSRAIAGLGLGFVFYFPLFLLRALRGGDVKLLAAAGAITGPGNIVWIFLLTSVFGGVIALIYAIIRGRLRRTMFNVSWIVRDLLTFKAPYNTSEELDVTTNKGLPLPHAPLMAAGVIAFILMARG